MKPEILSEKPTNSAAVKADLEKIKKRDGELSYRANKTLDHLNQTVILTEKQAKDLEKELTELDIPRLKENHIQKLIEILPVTLDQIKVVLQGYTLTVTQDNMKKVVDVIVKYA